MKTSIRRVVIGLGSNLGDREDFLNQVIQAIRVHPHFSNVAISSLYETKPVGGVGADYLNAVVAFDSRWKAADIYLWMMALEQNAGRERTVPNAPRTLDLDLLFYGAEQLATPQLTLPHPRLHERAFVLVPLSEIEPNWIHPVYKKTVLEMRNALSFEDLTEVKKYIRTPSRGDVLVLSNASPRDGVR